MANNSKTLHAKLLDVQQKLKAPKDQYNAFGKYSYRSAEGIETALKPLLAANGLVLTLTDEVGLYGAYVFCTSTATLYDTESGELLSVSAHAREDETKKGMDGAQISGAASSYARKYALCGLFLIDNTDDNDALAAKGEQAPKAVPKKGQQDKLAAGEYQRAKARLWAAIQAKAKQDGQDPKELLTEVLGAKEYQDTTEYMCTKAFEIEQGVQA